MKTFQEFQEQLQRGNVVPAPVPTAQQNRDRVKRSGDKQRTLTKKKLLKTATQGIRRHNQKMSELSPDTSHVGVHEDAAASEYAAAKQAYERSSKAKLAARRQSASSNPDAASARIKERTKEKIQTQLQKAQELGKRSIKIKRD